MDFEFKEIQIGSATLCSFPLLKRLNIKNVAVEITQIFLLVKQVTKSMRLVHLQNKSPT